MGKKLPHPKCIFPAFCFAILLICGIFASIMKITKRNYLLGFITVTLMLALTRCIFPSVAADRTPAAATTSDTLSSQAQGSDRPVTQARSQAPMTASRFFRADGTPVRNRIYSVPGFQLSFPDQQDVQLEAATHWGVSPVANRNDAGHRKTELVYVGSNPFFYIDKLNNSIPYLVPRASVLLQDIGRSFFDSLQVKGIQLHKIIATSVLRTKEDVQRLRNKNGNATENSCHLYGTTFDVCYNRYKTVEAPGEPRRQVRNDTLKWVLAEVLRDMRESGRCYVKYEVKQGCFHITVR